MHKIIFRNKGFHLISISLFFLFLINLASAYTNSPITNQEILNTLSTTLNVAIDDISNVTYSFNGGIINHTLCTDCPVGSNSTTISFPRQNYYTLSVYLTNSSGSFSEDILNLLVGNLTSSLPDYDSQVDTSTSGGNPLSYVTCETSSTSNTAEYGLFYYNYSNHLSSNINIINSTLSYYFTNTPSGQNLTILRVNSLITWTNGCMVANGYPNINNPSSGSSWNFSSIIQGIGTSSFSNKWATFDLIEQTQGILNGTYDYYSFATPYNYGTSTFLMSEYTTDVSLRPKFNITWYNQNTAPSINILTEDLIATNDNKINISYNYTDDNEYVKNITFWLDGTLNQTRTNPSDLNTNLNFSITGLADATYSYYIQVCDTDNSCTNSTTQQFTVSTDAPAIILDYPLANAYLNSGTNVYFNFTATDSNGLSTCQIWGNWTGTWHLNETLTSVTSGVQAYTIKNITEQNGIIWNVWCNDTTNSATFSAFNRTLNIDLTFPTLSINSISTTDGSQTITFSVNSSDLNLNSCKYSIFNSNGSIDGTNLNVSTSCNSLSTSATTTAYGIYNLTFYSIDLAGNENSTTSQFTTSAGSPVIINTGGGGGGAVSKITVVAITIPDGFDGTLSQLQRAILYSRIYNYSQQQTSLFSLTTSQKDILLDLLKKDKIYLTPEQLELFFQAFEDNLIESIDVSENLAKQYDLVKTTLVVEAGEFRVIPRSINTYTFYCTSKNWETAIQSNKLLESCENTEGNFNCRLKDNSTAIISYDLGTLGEGFFHSLSGEIRYTSQSGEVDYTVINTLNAINYCESIKILGASVNLLTLVIIGGFLLVFGSVIVVRYVKNAKK